MQHGAGFFFGQRDGGGVIIAVQPPFPCFLWVAVVVCVPEKRAEGYSWDRMAKEPLAASEVHFLPSPFS